MIQMEKAKLTHLSSQSVGDESLHYLGECFQENNDSIGHESVVGRFSWLVENHTLRTLQGCWVVSPLDKGVNWN